MSESTRDLLVRGIAAAKAGDEKEAHFFLEWVLRLDPPIHQCIEAWYWLSEVTPDPTVQREYLEMILINDPSDGRARRKLAVLEGRLDAGEIIDPDRIPKPETSDPKTTSVERFVCQKCGGRMTFTADGQSLTCEYCETRQQLAAPGDTGSSIQESDFLIALATRRGHTHPLWAQSAACTACGADLFHEGDQLSGACPYCDTTYAIEQIGQREIIAPDGILPLQLRLQQCRDAAAEWLQTRFPNEKYDLSTGQALYLPVWTFDIGGQVNWTCQVRKDRKWVAMNGQEIVYHNDLPVFAVSSLSAELLAALDGYNFQEMVDFDRRFLAGVSAQNYQIPLADASLRARKAALDHQRQKVIARLPAQLSDFKMDSSKILVESYRLVLVPTWLSHYEYDGRRCQIMVNGQTGGVYAVYAVYAGYAETSKPDRKSFWKILFGN